MQDKNGFFTKVNNNQILLFVKLTPNANANQIIGRQKNLFYEELKIKIKSAPVDGKANKELLSFLATELKTKPSAIKIIKGITATHKTLALIPTPNLEVMLLKLSKELTYLN